MVLIEISADLLFQAFSGYEYILERIKEQAHFGG
jgi:hypothetical protein